MIKDKIYKKIRALKNLNIQEVNLSATFAVVQNVL
jgi:hypothetical protein